MHTYAHAPFKFGGRVTTEFSGSHPARDVAPRSDDDGTVFAVEGGTVADTEDSMGPKDEHANMVIVRGPDQMLTVYAHVSPSVNPGDAIDKDDEIGDVDMSGDSTGRHVHLARLPGGDGTVDDVLDRQKKGVPFQFKTLQPW
jgi:murein DD-endopeptidase MepM/ murein hydrolase activator NlpD